MVNLSVLSVNIRIVLLVTLLSLVTSCSEKEQDIKIGVLINSASNPGRSLEMAAQLVEHQLTADPRFKTKSISFIKKDIGTTQESALSAFYNLISQHEITALVGPTTSQLATPIAIVANAHQIPLISPSASNIEVTSGKPFIFTAVFNNDLQSTALAEFVLNEISAEKIGILYDKSNAYNKTLALGFKALIESKNKSIYAYGYVSGETNFEPYLSKMKAAGIEVLFLPNFDRDISVQTAAIAKIDWRPIIIGSDSWHPQNYSKRTVVSETYFAHQWGVAVGQKNPRAQNFIEAFSQFHSVEPTIVSALSFDALNILLDVVNDAGINQEKIRKTISSINQYQGVSGQYSYLNSNIPHKPVYLFKASQNQISLHREIRND